MKNKRRLLKPLAFVFVGFMLMPSQLLFGLYVGMLLGRYGRRYRFQITRKTEADGVRKTKTKAKLEVDA